MERTSSRAVIEVLQPIRRPNVGEVQEGLSLAGGTHTGVAEKHEGGRSSRYLWWTERDPTFPYPYTAWGQEEEKLGVNLSQGNRKGWGKEFYNLILFLLILLWWSLGLKEINFPASSAFCPQWRIAKWSPWLYLDPRSFSHIFSSHSVEKEKWQNSLVGTWHLPKVNLTHLETKCYFSSSTYYCYYWKTILPKFCLANILMEISDITAKSRKWPVLEQ